MAIIIKGPNDRRHRLNLLIPFRLHAILLTVKTRYQIATAAFFVGIVGVISGLVLSPRGYGPGYEGKSRVLYKGKPFEMWFYGSNTTFFSATTLKPALEAVRALGTNAFPFLLSRLEEKRGNGALYRKVYQAMPAWIKGRLPYPLSGDDIKVMTLMYLDTMDERLTTEQLAAVADCVSSFGNPRVTMRFLMWIRMRQGYEVAPGWTNMNWLRLYRKLLSDPDHGIRLEAAIRLGESGILANPAEPMLFPILLSGLESQEDREHRLDITGYTFNQQPPGGSKRPLRKLKPGHPLFRSQDEDEMIQERIRTALKTLEPYLTPEQKARLSQVERPKLNEPQPIDAGKPFISPAFDLHY